MKITRLNDEDLGVDPFVQCLTMPACCHFVYRRNFMPEESIALIPAFGYSHQSQSFKALLWMKYLASSKNINIQHCRNGNEKQLGN